jgi:integrase
MRNEPEKFPLTDRGLRALKPAKTGERRMIWDAMLPNFGVRVTDKGKASFIVMRRFNGEVKRWRVGGFVTGTYPEARDLPTGQRLPLAEAREAARKVIALLDRGVDPDAAAEEQRREAERRRQDTFEAVTEEFIKRHVSKLRSAWNVEQTIRRELMPRFGKRPFVEITRRDVVALLEGVVDSGRPFIAFHLLAYLKKLYNWAIARDLYGIEASPCDRVFASDVIGELNSRDRVLTDAEIRALWDATGGELGYPFAQFARLLLITGQRLREVAEMTWDEVELDKALWTIPAARMKGDAAHEIPLAPAGVELLRSLPRFSGPFVFSATEGRRPIAGFTKAKGRLKALMLAALRKAAERAGEDPSKVEAPPRWTFHDLRRTMRTHLGGLPVPSDVAEMVIAHRLGGVRGTYDLHAYREEKRKALTLWAERLREIVGPAPRGNVVKFPARD